MIMIEDIMKYIHTAYPKIQYHLMAKWFQAEINIFT